MQSGKARTKEWFLDYEPEQPREIEPLMGLDSLWRHAPASAAAFRYRRGGDCLL